MQNLLSTVKRYVSLRTHKIYELPILILMPHSRCNCRCVMCDIWQANQNKQEISYDDLLLHIKAMQKMKVKWVVLSGGEALMHSNLWKLCELLKAHHIKITLLSTGLLLKKNATEIVKNFEEVIVSLDGSQVVHNQIRNIPQAYEKLAEGVQSLHTINPNYRITARSVIQKANFRDLPHIVESAKELKLQQISFLTADVSTAAFNRSQPWENQQISQIALNEAECDEFESIIEKLIEKNKLDFKNRFINENPTRMRSFVQYYRAILGKTNFPQHHCNAPWVSTVIETNGDVLPCFFQPKIGNIYENNLADILNSPKSIQFRKNLNVQSNPICQKCVCYLNLKPSQNI